MLIHFMKIKLPKERNGRLAELVTRPVSDHNFIGQLFPEFFRKKLRLRLEGGISQHVGQIEEA